MGLRGKQNAAARATAAWLIPANVQDNVIPATSENGALTRIQPVDMRVGLTVTGQIVILSMTRIMVWALRGSIAGQGIWLL